MTQYLACLLLLFTVAVQAAPEASPVTANSSTPGSLLKTFSSGNSAEPVDPEQAFRVNVTAAGPNELLLRFTIADCCYLYRDKTKIELATSASAAPTLGKYELPPGTPKADEFIGSTAVYHHSFELRVPINGLTQPSGAALRVTYQGCAETPVAICYAPITKTFALDSLDNALSPSPTPPPANGKFLLYLLGAFGFGMLLTFTPCVLPMVPILSSAIVGSGDKKLTKLEGGLLSYSYVVGTAVTYTVAGALAGASGEHLQAYFQNPWAIGTFTAILGVLALSMFGFFELQIPGFIQSFLHHHSHHVHQRSRHLRGGAYFGVFVLGLLSALIVGACATPILLTVLGAAMQTHDPVLGGSLMFALAHGQGVFLVLLGVGASFLLPKVGTWMETIKHVFGAMLIAVAIYLLGALPAVPVLMLWGTFFIVSGVYLGANQRLPDNASGWRYLWKGLGTVLLIWGILALVGGFAGERDVLHPLPTHWQTAAVNNPAGAVVETTRFIRVRNVADLEQHLAQAKAAGRPVVVDYYADWCTDCVRMEGTTFRNPDVQKALKNVVALQADITENSHSEIQALKQRFGIYAPPAMVFIDASGQERRELLVYGFQSTTELLARLGKI
ncbi:MAG: protein-disulfide reductase DsbD [Gammaproteobacteria bacterium]|nr:protein-disulfide reductase DsbD [Gammaproteobacteria bacterium]